MPSWIRQDLEGSGLLDAYRERPPYQRNDYIGWITRAVKEKTRQKRLAQMLDELERGDVYMKMDWGRSGRHLGDHPSAASDDRLKSGPSEE